MITEINTSNPRGIPLVCRFGCSYIACKPSDLSEDALLGLPMREFWSSSVFGEQFITNLHEWRNDKNILDRLFAYSVGDDYLQANYTPQEVIDFVSLQLEHRQLLIFSVEDKKPLFNNNHLFSKNEKTSLPIILSEAEKIERDAFLDSYFGDQSIKPVSITPIDWLVDDIKDSASLISDIVSNGPNLAAVASLGVTLIPGKFADDIIDKVLDVKILPKSVLDDANLLGSGAYKSAFNVDENSVFLTPIVSPLSGGVAHTLDDLLEESKTLDFISSFDIPTLNISEIGKINLPDGVVEGIISDKKYFNGKDVFGNIRKGTNPQGITLSEVYEIITPDTLSVIEKMEQTILKENLVIKDFQLMFGTDGLPVVADSLGAFVSSADNPALQRTLESVNSNKIMIENILKSK